MTDNNKKKTRVRALKTSGDVVKENALIYSEFRRGLLTRADASTASNILTNQRNMLESTKNEERLDSIEQKLEQFVANQGQGNVVQFKRQA